MENLNDQDKVLVEIICIKNIGHLNVNAGDIAKIDTIHANKLIEHGFARLLTENDKISIMEKEAKQVSKPMIQVFFLKAHPKFAYPAGSFGIVAEKYVQELLNTGYVDLVK